MQNYEMLINQYNEKNPSSVIEQYFPSISEDMIEGNFYPKVTELDKYFLTNEQRLKFGVFMMIGFLNDTIAVEHHLVIPVVTTLYGSKFNISNKIKKHLYKTITDEGHHADQSLSLIESIKDRFNLKHLDVFETEPLFLKKLNFIKNKLKNKKTIELICIINSIVTETRISKELGVFANDKSLIKPIRKFCKSHQTDEAFHSLLFRWLGEEIWGNLNKTERENAALYFAKSTIARNYPDTQRIQKFLSLATGICKTDSKLIVEKEYNQSVINNELKISATPTIRYLDGKLDILKYKKARELFDLYNLI